MNSFRNIYWQQQMYVALIIFSNVTCNSRCVYDDWCFSATFDAQVRLNGPSDLQSWWSEVRDESPFGYVHAEIQTRAVAICDPMRDQLDHGGTPYLVRITVYLELMNDLALCQVAVCHMVTYKYLKHCPLNIVFSSFLTN